MAWPGRSRGWARLSVLRARAASVAQDLGGGVEPREFITLVDVLDRTLYRAPLRNQRMRSIWTPMLMSADLATPTKFGGFGDTHEIDRRIWGTDLVDGFGDTHEIDSHSIPWMSPNPHPQIRKSVPNPRRPNLRECSAAPAQETQCQCRDEHNQAARQWHRR